MRKKIQDNIHNWIIAFSTSNSTIPNIRAPFIQCRHLYSASSSGTAQKRSQPQRGQIMLF